MASDVRALHHRSDVQAVMRRVGPIVDRLNVALQFSAVEQPAVCQVLHAVRFAFHGAEIRDDDDYLPGLTENEVLALVNALLPFVVAARKRPGCEGCSICMGKAAVR